MKTHSDGTDTVALDREQTKALLDRNYNAMIRACYPLGL
jgi:hypothetical protein